MSDGVLRALDGCAAVGRPARLWWRDDDAVEPTPALDRLLSLSTAHGVPATLAVIPAHADAPLAHRLRGAPTVNVAQHGWSHDNHAPPDEKKQELGPHRPAPAVLGQLAQGSERLSRLFGTQFAPVLVPPWNRIAPAVADGLTPLGFRALSVYGPARPGPLPVINTHVDLIDWHGTRGGRPEEELLDELARVIALPEPIGILSHHLVHDETAWRFLDRLFVLTAGHPGCRWAALADLLPAG